MTDNTIRFLIFVLARWYLKRRARRWIRIAGVAVVVAGAVGAYVANRRGGQQYEPERLSS